MTRTAVVSLTSFRACLRRRSLRTCAALIGASMVALGACADSPAAPASDARLVPSTPRFELLDPSAYANGLLRDKANDKPIVTTIDVPKGGGAYRLPGGLHIDIAGGTFRQATTLTVTMLPGNVVAYDFQPHGLVFNKPLAMSQDLRGTNWQGRDISKFGVGYFANETDLNMLTKQALVKEFLRTEIDLRGNRAHFQVFHFSGYMMSTGLVEQVDGGAEGGAGEIQ